MARCILLVLSLSFLAQAQQSELRDYTFKREVVFQTLDNGKVNGQTTRTSVFTLGDDLERIETDIEQSGKLKGLRITDEDWADLRDIQLLGPDASKDRYLAGSVERDSQGIVKISGRVWPQGKQRFPQFTTYYDLVDGHRFPVRIEADDVLKFPSGDIHFRIKVRLFDYKKFRASEPIITEPEVTTTTITEGAPVSGLPRWSKSEVRVKFAQGFTDSQQAAILLGANSWGVRFIVGEPHDLLVARADFRGKSRYAQIQTVTNDGVLGFAIMEFDLRTTKLDALKSFAAHETGHSLGHTDCSKCDSVMQGYRGPNKTNGHIAPTEVDIRALREAVVRE